LSDHDRAHLVKSELVPASEKPCHVISFSYNESIVCVPAHSSCLTLKFLNNRSRSLF
jgi:hypothetical protein